MPLPSLFLQRSKAQAYGVLALRSNRWLLALIGALPVSVASLRLVIIAITPPSSWNATAGLEIQSGLVVPAFLLAMFFGLFAARPDDPQIRMDGEYIDEPRRRRVWLAKFVVITAVVGSVTMLSQAVIALFQLGLPAASRAATASLLPAAAAYVVVVVVAACLGMAVAKLVRDALTGAFVLTLAFWLIPTLAMPLLGAVSNVGPTASDFNPVQLAERLVWQPPAVPLSFQGLAQSKLESTQAWLALGTWLAGAIIMILGVTKSFGARRRSSGRRGQQARLIPTTSKTTHEITTPVAGFLGPVRAALYRLAIDRGVFIFLAIIGLFEAYTTLHAASDVMIRDSSNRLESMFFAYGPTPMIAIFFFVAIRRSRDLATGEQGQRVIESGSRVRVFLRDWLAQSLLYATVGLVVLAIAWTAAFAGSRHQNTETSVAIAMAFEGALKFAALTTVAVAWGLGLAHAISKPSATLIATLSITLLIPGIVVAICVALGALEFLAQANYWLPTQVLVPQHDPGEAGLAFDAFGHTLMTPNQRMLIAGVYGLIALGVGSLAARFKALL
ncbi:MAG: hypothetical protein RL672_92 [Actinomycetota bacterium]